jgi:hypothetical protein
MPFGAVIVGRDGRVGDELPRDAMAPLRRALCAALVDLNPSFLEQDDQTHPNAGNAVASADNAQVYGHPLTGEHSYVLVEGAMVRRMNLVYAPPGRPFRPIPRPPGLPTPLLGRGLDTEYAAALYTALRQGDTAARRLDRCIQWQVVAWTNTELVAEDVRILAFRAAFDVLLGGGSQTRQHGRALATLLADASRQRPRDWMEHGQRKEMALNDTEWWFQSLALLRNAIAHGDIITDQDWLFDDGKRHLWHADHRLRQAIKKTVVAVSGNEELELDAFTRHIRRETARVLREHDGG